MEYFFTKIFLQDSLKKQQILFFTFIIQWRIVCRGRIVRPKNANQRKIECDDVGPEQAEGDQHDEQNEKSQSTNGHQSLLEQRNFENFKNTLIDYMYEI